MLFEALIKFNFDSNSLFASFMLEFSPLRYARRRMQADGAIIPVPNEIPFIEAHWPLDLIHFQYLAFIAKEY